MHEWRFQDACEAFNDVLIDEAHSLHLLQDRRQQSIQILKDQVVKLKRIMRLADTMTTKSPRCPTILMSPEGYFQEEFQEICRGKILPTLKRAVKILKSGDETDCQVSYTAAAQLELAQEDLVFALDSRE